MNGGGFCCNDTPTTRSFDPGKNDNPELYQFYYHSDHLGSSSLITNLDGEIVQHIEYVPFGEVFIEERNNKWNTPFLFNAKELDEETGLYYYGARYYDPRTSIWISTDPQGEKNPDKTTYHYCSNNPFSKIDPDGEADFYDQKGVWRGTDGQNNNHVYVAKGKTLSAINKATKVGQYYNGNLVDSKTLARIPDNATRTAVEASVANTRAHGLEFGGHKTTSGNIQQWDGGTPARITETHPDGSTKKVVASIATFMIGGTRQAPAYGDVEHYWHIHPTVSIGGLNLGASNPSPADYTFQGNMENGGYLNNAFLVGSRDNKVQFYNSTGNSISMKYSTFLGVGSVKSGKSWDKFNAIRSSLPTPAALPESAPDPSGRMAPLQ
ncbi:RHS repeat domain-containing protein [Dysgonomonas sp. ZJ279]|uniref:RHS repeat domain-containing protein n=1 Tax=Dysgonomonas sp. ZJ279 TaxID=2709796 RepID=UPI0013E9E5C0|nr:RHS repeat-associated core domain-containing protein [Dysgonomonas sp. ZJ279]